MTEKRKRAIINSIIFVIVLILAFFITKVEAMTAKKTLVVAIYHMHTMVKEIIR